MKTKILVLLLILMMSLTILEAKIQGQSIKKKDTKKNTTELVEPGTLTITGLEKFNDSFIQASAGIGNKLYIDAGSHESDRNLDMTLDHVKMLVGGTIKDGKVKLTVWELKLVSTEYDKSWEQDANTYERIRYTGNDELEMHVEIWQDNETYHLHYGEGVGNIKVKFQNGIAEGKFVETVYTE